MTDTELICPNCGFAIPLTEALSAPIRAQLEASLIAEHEQQLREAEERARAAEARELEHRRRAVELEAAQRTAAERIRLETEEALRREHEARLQTLLQEATARIRNETALELRLTSEQLAEAQRRLAEAQRNELALRQQATALEERARSLDLEIARRLDEKKAEWEAGLRQRLGEEQSLKLKEKEKQIEDLKKLVDEMKRKSEQGSQELQGEVLELDIQAALERQFPQDVIEPIARGVRGADLVQQVRNGVLQPCGSIVWECKNTKNWQPAWIGKLKEDQRACGAALAVILTVALPPGIRDFGLIDGVWVASRGAWPALAVALREQLIEVARARKASVAMAENMEALYRYLAGEGFRHRVQALVETMDAMRAGLDRERRAMEKLWKEREKQIERMILGTAGMYGEMRGILGSSLAEVAALTLEGCEGLLEEASE